MIGCARRQIILSSANTSIDGIVDDNKEYITVLCAYEFVAMSHGWIYDYSFSSAELGLHNFLGPTLRQYFADTRGLPKGV